MSEFVFPNRSWMSINVNRGDQGVMAAVGRRAEVPYRPLMQTRHTYATLMLQKVAPIDWLQKQMGHRNLTIVIRPYWRWINMGELSHEPSVRSEAAMNSSNQPQPDPTRADGATSREA
jgi:integrase